MTATEFDTQFNRLTERWKTAYSNEFKKILWHEFQYLPNHAMERIITRLIGDCRQPPMMPEFRDYRSMERDKSWVEEKKQNTLDAKAFFEGSRFSDDEKKNFMTMIRRKVNNAVKEEDWDAFLKIMDETNRAPIPKKTDDEWG